MFTLNVSENLPVRTQFLFFTLLGDYVLLIDGKIWTSSIVHLMGLLGVSERAVRSTLSRMTHKGWITSEKHGRRSLYIITPRGRVLLEAGHERIFEAILSDWNKKWHLVVYSVPEKDRRKRHALRKQLAWLGFGRLAPGTWISPHNRRTELRSLFDELDIGDYVELFSGLHHGPSASKELIRRCWDLRELEAEYQKFVARHQPEYQHLIAENSVNGGLKPEESFIRRFCITHEYQAIPLKDPNLPTALLPSDWIGITARELLDDYRDLLVEDAMQFVKDIKSGDGIPPQK